MLVFEVYQTRESCFLQSENPLGVFFFFQIPSGFSYVFTEERIESGHAIIKGILVECCCDVCPSPSFSHLHILYIHGAQLEWPSDSWSTLTTLPKTLLRLLSLASSTKCPGWSQLLPLRIMEVTCSCEPSMQQNFLKSSPDFCSTKSCRPYLWVQGLVRPNYVPFQVMFNQLNLPQVNTNQSEETSQRQSSKTGMLLS